MKVSQFKRILTKHNKVAKTAYNTQSVYIHDGKIQSQNLQTILTSKIDFKGTGEFEIDDLIKIAKHLKNSDEINISFDNGKAFIHVNGVSLYEINCKVESKWRQMADVQILGLLPDLNPFIPFISKDELRQAITGICIRNSKISATDAHKLIWQECDIDKEESLIIPHDIVKLCSGNMTLSKVSRAAETTRYQISNDFERIEFQPIDAKFPLYESIIPREFRTTINVKKEELEKHIKQALVCAPEHTNQIVFKLDEKYFNISSEHNNMRYRQVMVCSASGANMRIGFNGKLLLECIKNEKEVEMKFNLPNQAAIINDSILIMPVMLLD